MRSRSDGYRRHGFRAMGTLVSLVSDGEPAADTFERAARAVERVFAREELRFSRFRIDSELSRVNASAGAWTEISAPFAALLSFALAAAGRTGGRFDPTMLPALLAAGYDRDFDRLLTEARSVLHPPQPGGRWREIRLTGRGVRLPAGVQLDLGGVAKGWTVDLAAEAAVRAGLRWGLVNGGGDLRLVGSPPDGCLIVAVEDPHDASEAGRVILERGALATSSVTRRAWGPGLHHVMDPWTGRPARTPVLQATAWGPTCAEAEVRSTVALLDGPDALGSFTGLLVTPDGEVVTNMPLAAPEEEVA